MRGIVFVFAISVAYSVVRYAVFAPENYANLPVLIVNKGVAMAAALCFAIGFLQQMRKRRGITIITEPAVWFRAGVFGAIAHIPMSLAILRPAYFGEFFDGERLSFAGEMVFLFGGLTAGGLYLLTRTHWTARVRWVLSLMTLTTLLVHVLSMGYCRGLNINASHAYLPPMWLLSAIGVAMAALWLLRSRPNGQEQQPESAAPWMQDPRQ